MIFYFNLHWNSYQDIVIESFNATLIEELPLCNKELKNRLSVGDEKIRE